MAAAAAAGKTGPLCPHVSICCVVSHSLKLSTSHWYVFSKLICNFSCMWDIVRRHCATQAVGTPPHLALLLTSCVCIQGTPPGTGCKRCAGSLPGPGGHWKNLFFFFFFFPSCLFKGLCEAGMSGCKLAELAAHTLHGHDLPASAASTKKEDLTPGGIWYRQASGGRASQQHLHACIVAQSKSLLNVKILSKSSTSRLAGHTQNVRVCSL